MRIVSIEFNISVVLSLREGCDVCTGGLNLCSCDRDG